MQLSNNLYQELLAHTITTIEDQDLNDFEDLHFKAFNEDYYIIGYYNAEQWLQKHDISAFEAIEAIFEWQLDTFGEITLAPEDINAERIVNLYTYVAGEALLDDFDLDQPRDELLAELREHLDDDSEAA